MRANLLWWMTVTAGVRAANIQDLAGSLDLIIVLEIFHLPLQVPTTPFSTRLSTPTEQKLEQCPKE